MKKLALVALFISFTSLSFAQKAKFATLRVMYTSQQSNVPNAEAVTSFDTYGGFGMLLSDNLSVAMELGYNTQKVNEVKKITLKPSVRYTWWITDEIGLFTGLGFPYTTQTAKSYPSGGTGGVSVDVNTNTYGATVMPGIMIFPFEKIAFDLSFDWMNYTIRNVEIDGVENKAASGTDFNMGVSGFGTPNVTVYYVF